MAILQVKAEQQRVVRLKKETHQASSPIKTEIMAKKKNGNKILYGPARAGAKLAKKAIKIAARKVGMAGAMAGAAGAAAAAAGAKKKAKAKKKKY